MDYNNLSVKTIEELYTKKFRNDATFQDISREYVRIKPHELQMSDQILRRVILQILLPRMRQDKVFDELFETVKCAGSVSKGLKVGKPDEYDLMLDMSLPIDNKCLLIEPDEEMHEFVKIRVKDNSLNGYKDTFSHIMSEQYLDQCKFRNWIYSVLIKALNSLQLKKSLLLDNSNVYIFRSRKKNIYEIKYRQSNPAFTLQVTSKTANYKVDFDLVPCLQFENKEVTGFRQPEGNKWLVIAKPLRDMDRGNFLWRTGFYEAEKKLLKTSLTGQLKPIIRMFKKFRDDQEWTNIKSYFIENLFYNALSNEDFKMNFQRFSRTSIFVYMLMRFEKNLEDQELRSYWQKRHNLFDKLNPIYLNNIAGQLGKILSLIKNNGKDTAEIVKKTYFRELLRV